jgi:hypothetical protein
LAFVWPPCACVLLVSFAVALCCALRLHVLHASFGAAFTAFYRLVGPFKTNTVVPVIKTELWDTITRRGILGNILMGIIPMLFYSMLNLYVYAFEKAWIALKAG